MAENFELYPLDIDKFIKVNECQEVDDPVAFNNNTSPSPRGLLSNEIFGITMEDRAGTFAYIDLGEYFIHPLHYRIWGKTESKVKQVVHGTSNFKIDKNGDLVEDENGESGIKFLKDNVSKLSFGHGKREKAKTFLKANTNTMFINKYIVIPPYYRDVNSENAKLGLGEINKLYQSLIIAVRSLKESKDYGLTLSDATRGRIQEILLQIYDWFGAGTTINGEDAGGNLPGKFGIIRRANMSKTTDYSCRLVISPQQLKVESIDDMLIDPNHTGIPLAASLVNWYPYVLFFIRRFFENEFAGKTTYPIIDKKTGEVKNIPLKDWQIYYSDDMIKKQIDRYIHGQSNRFIPIEVPVDYKEKVYMKFKGREITTQDVADNNYENYSIIDRHMTWCDLFYIACTEITKDKVVLLTRFPMDSYFNQYPAYPVVMSTKDTEPVYIDGYGLYKKYPKIREKDLYTNTSSKFVDTLVPHNSRLVNIDGDYDGDQMTVKPIYTKAATEELKRFMDSKASIINLNGINNVYLNAEGIQTLYNLTISPDSSVKLGEPVF